VSSKMKDSTPEMALQFTFIATVTVCQPTGRVFLFFANFSTNVPGPLKLENRKSLPSDGHSSPRDVPEINILSQTHLVDMLWISKSLAELNTFTSLGLTFAVFLTSWANYLSKCQ
jgi:hypothetical protein